MDDKKTIIHIGLAKTGTSFLQTEVFPNLTNVFKRIVGTIEGNPTETPFDEIVNLRFMDFEENKFKHSTEEVRNYITNNITEPRLFISSDLLSNNFFLKYFGNEKGNEKEIIYNLIKDFFPSPKFFLVVRKQDDWINSIYNQCIKHANRELLSLNEFTGYRKGKFMQNDKHLDCHSIDWYEIVKFIEDRFGAGSVFVLPYELFKSDKNEFLKQFYEHYSLEPFYPDKPEKRVNESKKYHPEYFYRKYLKFRHSLPEKLQKTFEKNDKGLLKVLYKIELKVPIEKLSKKQSEQIIQMHKESNKKLADYVGIDLSEYGYY